MFKGASRTNCELHNKFDDCIHIFQVNNAISSNTSQNNSKSLDQQRFNALKLEFKRISFSRAGTFFLYRQKHKYIRKGHLEENPKALRGYTKGTLRPKQKKRRYKTIPQLAPSQSRAGTLNAG